MIGTYVTTALVHAAPTVPGTALAAVIGPVAEIVLVKVGVFAYNVGSDGLFGVGPWLPPLYFAFGVVVALLGELCAKRALAQAGRG